MQGPRAPSCNPIAKGPYLVSDASEKISKFGLHGKNILPFAFSMLATHQLRSSWALGDKNKLKLLGLSGPVAHWKYKNVVDCDNATAQTEWPKSPKTSCLVSRLVFARILYPRLEPTRTSY